MSQVRLDDDNADWLRTQGGSLSSSANRILRWARETIDAAPDDDYDDGPVIEVDDDDVEPEPQVVVVRSRPRRRASTSFGRRPGW